MTMIRPWRPFFVSYLLIVSCLRFADARNFAHEIIINFSSHLLAMKSESQVASLIFIVSNPQILSLRTAKHVSFRLPIFFLRGVWKPISTQYKPGEKNT